MRRSDGAEPSMDPGRRRTLLGHASFAMGGAPDGAGSRARPIFEGWWV